MKSKPKLKSKKTQGGDSYRKKNPKTFWLLFILLMFGVILALLGIISMMGMGPGAAATTSTLNLTSHVDGENVTDKIEVKTWQPKSDAKFDDMEDIRDPNNYKTLDKGDAEDISFDIRLYEWVKIEIEPDSGSYFANCEYFVAGGANAENNVIDITVFHLSSDVNFNMFNITNMDEVTVATVTNASYIIMADFPRVSTLERHYGSGWDMSTSDYGKLNAHEKAEFADQRNWRTQPKLYDSAVDTSYKYDSKLLKLTTTFAFKITLNATLSRIVGNAAYFDLDLLDLEDSGNWKIQYSTTTVYLISYQNLKAPFDVSFQITLGTDIIPSNIHSGRATIPEETVTAFSAYSTIAA